MDHEQPPQPEPDEPEGGEQEPPVTPRIWVGSLSDYNDGVLHGEWLDAARESDDIHSDIHSMLATSPTAARTGQPAEEWGIFDHEGFGRLRIDEYESIDYVSRLARGIVTHGLAFAAWTEISNGDDTLDQFDRAYLGHFDGLDAYAQQLVDDGGYEQLLDNAVPQHLRPYVHIDTAGLGLDLWLGGDINLVHADDGGVWIFDAHVS
jgi:antirestriction protein